MRVKFARVVPDFREYTPVLNHAITYTKTVSCEGEVISTMPGGILSHDRFVVALDNGNVVTVPVRAATVIPETEGK